MLDTDSSQIAAVAPAPLRHRASITGTLHKLVDVAALAGPAVVTLTLASDGVSGSTKRATGLAIVGLALVLFARVALEPRALLRLGRPLTVVGGALATLTLWTVASAVLKDGDTWWATYDQLAVYALAFVLLGSIELTPGRLRAVLLSVGGALVALTLAAVVVRLVPAAADVTLGSQPDRISWPLGHWNSVGLVAALATVLCVHFAADERGPAVLRIVGALVLPATSLCLLLTSSRGQMACAAVGLLAYVLVARPRGLIGAAAAALPTGAAVLLAGYYATEITSYTPTSDAAVEEGGEIAVLLVFMMLLAAIIRAAMLGVDRMVARVRIPRWSAAVGVGAALLVVAASAAAVDLPDKVDRAYQTFTGEKTDAWHAGNATDHFENFSSNDHLDRWKDAARDGRDHLLTGAGIGTFQFSGELERMYGQRTPLEDEAQVDAESMFLQTFAELGLFGLIPLLVAMAGMLVCTAFRAGGGERRVVGAAFALAATWTAGAAIDMSWQLPATSVAVFGVAGLALARPRPERTGSLEPGELFEDPGHGRVGGQVRT